MKTVDESRIESILAMLTLDEKLGMIHGGGVFRTSPVERLHIPAVVTSDGPRGVRREFTDLGVASGTTDDYVSYLPGNSATAATWNKSLAGEVGRVLGEEARGRGKDIILAPGVNIQRSPLCGRNFEYFSEDPKLCEEMAVPMIEGIQQSDVAACVKHFAVNSQETDRFNVNTHVDEKTLREIYFPCFRAAVQKAGSLSLMGAYNQFEGEQCSESKHLLTDILRAEWNYDGVIVSDWGAVHHTKEAAESGLDIEMACSTEFEKYYMADPLKEAIEKGELSEELVNEKVRNILRLMLRLKMLEPESAERAAGCYNTEEHRKVLLKAAQESVVLLKNETHALPLQKQKLKKLAVIGYNAELCHAAGGGSAEIKALYEISPLMGIKKTLGGNTEVQYAPGYWFAPCTVNPGIYWRQPEVPTDPEEIRKQEQAKRRKEEALQRKNKRLHDEAVQLAGNVEDVILVVGLSHHDDVEGRDRATLSLPYNQDQLIEDVLKVNPNAIVVVCAGSPVAMPWEQKAKTIVWSWYAGMEGGTGLADVLFGKVSPSGRLPITLPKSLADSPAHCIGEFGTTGSVTYHESDLVGYRFFDKYNKEPLFCFGHGLSYTEFAYSGAEVVVAEKGTPSVRFVKGGDVDCTVSLTVTNIGAMAGCEVVQVYVAAKPEQKERPLQELVGFVKVYLEPGEEKRVVIPLTKEAFGYYDTEHGCFYAPNGEYEIRIGNSSREYQVVKVIELEASYLYR